MLQLAAGPRFVFCKGGAGAMVDEVTQERLLYVPARRFVHVAFVQKLQERTATGDLDIYVADTSATPSMEGGQ